MPFNPEDVDHRSSRRGFLKAAAMSVMSLALPTSLAGRTSSTSSWFLHAETGESWVVNDAVSWSLENARHPILERAREGLLKLTPGDAGRIIRLVTRRCKLNLIELQPQVVVIHYWGQQGLGDLRPFFKQHGLARQSIKLVLIDRKREVCTIQSGDDFLYGERLTSFFPIQLFMSKWAKRERKESDDWTAAPGTTSGFAREGIEPGRIPWAALKSAWRRGNPFLCLNCDGPTILTNFGFQWRGMFNRCPRFIHVCRQCGMLFEDGSIDRWQVRQWLATNLDAEVWPDYDLVWDRSVKWEPPLPT